ncbi:MAG TPA: pyridoxal-phosphate dependent enzyme [Blastocatellia bacterium]|nr:pyridoxal-phosphate dependent enzyme [Blastocatellia bacterium]
MTTPALAVSYSDVEAARRRIGDRAHRTAVVRSRLLDAMAGRSLFLKCENLQRGGSFKIRGATNKLLSLTDEERKRGVVAFSSGNHAQAVALASRELGVDAVIVMPEDAPAAKVAATEAYGARIVRYDRMRDDREVVAREFVDREGRMLVPPYDDPAIIAGQGTAALELLDEVESLDVVVVPVGGGGLLAGTATAVSGRSPETDVFGVEPDTANDFQLSLEEGVRVTTPPSPTIADGARPQTPGVLTFPIVRERAAGILLVPDSELIRAMRELLTYTKMLVEPTGALGVAAVLSGALPERYSRVGIVISGGNVDLATLAGFLA